MLDPRIQTLANQLVNFSTEIAKGDRVLVDLYDVPDSIGIALLRAVRAAGGVPFMQVNRARLSRELLRQATDEQAATQGGLELNRITKMQAYIGVRGADNIFENSDVPADVLKLWSRHLKKAWDHRVKKTRWVVLRWPGASMAQQAQMSTERGSD